MTNNAEARAREVAMPVSDAPGRPGATFAMGPHFEQAAQRNHGQSLTRLAQRGGLSWCEAAAIAEMRPWFAMNATAAEKIVRAALKELPA